LQRCRAAVAVHAEWQNFLSKYQRDSRRHRLRDRKGNQSMSLDKMIAVAVELAAKAWDGNSELRWLFGRSTVGTTALLGGDDVGAMLRQMHRKRQILHFNPPTAGDRMLAHAVLGEDDYYNTPTRKFAARQTILLAGAFFLDSIKQSVTFSQASATDIGAVTPSQMRAVILLHEARHLYTLRGHGPDPATHDPTWNDYILWTGFLGRTVARRV
jgi:hypothetical protein